MPISIVCPHCKTMLDVADDAAGKAVRCAKCQGVSTVIVSEPVQPATISTNELIACRACNHMIARAARTCPGCGAPNTWIHPEIQRFINGCKSFRNTPPFQYVHEALILQGTAEVKKGGHATADKAIKAMGIGGLCFILGPFLPPSLAYLAWIVGPLGLLRMSFLRRYSFLSLSSILLSESESITTAATNPSDCSSSISTSHPSHGSPTPSDESPSTSTSISEASYSASSSNLSISVNPYPAGLPTMNCTGRR